MKLSTDRILTTHVGSLPRPADLYDLLVAEDRGETKDSAALEARVAGAVTEIVAQQVAAGIDVVGDGEMGKIAYTFYVKHRLSGIEDGEPPGAELPEELINADLRDHPDFSARVSAARGRSATSSRHVRIRAGMRSAASAASASVPKCSPIASSALRYSFCVDGARR